MGSLDFPFLHAHWRRSDCNCRGGSHAVFLRQPLGTQIAARRDARPPAVRAQRPSQLASVLAVRRKNAKTRPVRESSCGLPVRRATMSRVLFTSIAAALLATMLSMPAQAQQRPQIETTKVDGTDNVYIFRNGNHQSMFVVTKDGVIATDPIAYGRPNGGQQYVGEIKKVTDKPIKN